MDNTYTDPRTDSPTQPTQTQDKQYDKDEYIQGMTRAIQNNTDYVREVEHDV